MSIFQKLLGSGDIVSKGIELIEDDFLFFKEECEKWIDKYSLGHYEINFAFSDNENYPDNEDYLARTEINFGLSACVVKLAKYQNEEFLNDENKNEHTDKTKIS